MKALKWIGIVLVGLFILGLLLPDDDKNNTNTANNTEVSEEVSEKAKDDIEVVKFSETATESMSTVHVEVKNNTKELLSTGQIKVIYENKAGDIVGTGLGTIVNLAAGATKVVDCLAMDVVGADTYRVEVTPLLYE
jgi:hypothetical protein